MTTTRKLTSITTALALAATALGPLATSASAEGWHDGRGRGHQHAYRGDDDRNWGRGKHRGYHRYHRRHRDRDDTGKYIALGVGALMLGVILSEAARH
jgi:Ni/Co efflux regulator RcnB